MANLLKALFNRSEPRRTHEPGWIYVADEDNGPMRQARPGALISTVERKLPWLVVHHDLSRATIARWPGRLWRAEIVEAVNGRDQPLHTPDTAARGRSGSWRRSRLPACLARPA